DVKVEKVVSIAEVITANATTTTVDELTLAQTLIEIKAAKPKAVTAAATTTTTTVTRSKARGVVVQEPNQILVDEEIAQRLQEELQAELEEEERLARQKEEEDNLISCDNTQAMMEHSQLKNKSFKEIQMLFDNTMKWVDSFVPMDTEVVEGSKSQAEGSKKRTREELKNKRLMEIVPDEEIAVDAISLAIKPPIIVDWKIIEEGKMGYF
ncbi:hypothetical protein Tco_1510817, partial [Tanacetum coccineum]